MDRKQLSDTAQKVISEASEWSFEGDCLILQWMEEISKNLEARAKTTLQSLDHLITNVSRSQIDLENTQNSLAALQYSQYVEMRCQEETATETENDENNEQKQQPEKLTHQEILQGFLQNNVKMLQNCHDKFNFLEESDEDDSNTTAVENCIYQPRNPYNERLLPHIYGTKMWKEQSHVGLEDESLVDYSGDEKSEVYSISSTSSMESDGRETPESHITANTSQYTSSVSLNNEIYNIIKTTKAMTGTSNTPSISSVPLDSSARNEPVVPNSTVTLQPSNPLDYGARNEPVKPIVPDSAATLQPSSSFKKPTLNLFDDNDYKNLMSEIVDRNQSLEKSKKSIKIQADNSKIDLFAGDDDSSPPIPTKKPTQNSTQTNNQKISSVNLFDSPTEPVHSLFQDFRKPDMSQTTNQVPFLKTKLSTRNLFDDDDADDDFLSIFAKKTPSSAVTKNTEQLNKTVSQSLFENDELDRQEVSPSHIAKNVSEALRNKTASASSTNPTKSLFFEDDDNDDFFVSNPIKSNITKSLEQPRNDTFPVYLSSEPPEDIDVRQTVATDRNKTQKELDFEIDVNADEDDDDFMHLFGNKQPTKKKPFTVETDNDIVRNISVDNTNTQNTADKAVKEEQNKQIEQIYKSDLEKGKSGTAIEIAGSSETLKKKKHEDNKTEELVSESSKPEIIEADKLKTTSELMESVVTMLNEESETHKAVNESTSFRGNEPLPYTTSINSSAWLTDPPLDNKLHDNTLRGTSGQIVEPAAVEEDGFLSIFNKKKLTMSETHKTANESSSIKADESVPNTNNSDAWLTDPPIDDKLEHNTLRRTSDSAAVEEDDFLSISNKKKLSITETHKVANESSSIKVDESLPSTTADNSNAWLTDSPIDDKLEDNTLRSTFEQTVYPAAVEEDDFLSIFNKKKIANPKDFENRETLHKEKSDFSSTAVETTSQTPPEILETPYKLSEENSTTNTFENFASKQIEPSNDAVETIPNPYKSPAYDTFSPLFLDEPPDDDDFLQAISSASSSNIAPALQYNAINDFYEPTSQNLTTETNSEENQQIHTGYNIRLFDELPPDDNEEQSSANNIEVTTPTPSKPNTLSNLFTTNKFSNFLDELTSEADEDIFEKTQTPQQFGQQQQQQQKTVTDKVQVFEKPTSTSKEQTEKSPSKIVSKLKLPKIDINVQALLPNAGAGKSLKRTVETEKLAKEPEQQLPLNKAENNEPKTISITTIAKDYANEPEKAHLLPSLCKSRVRVPVKRRSSTRAGRQESYRQTLQAESKTNDNQTDSSTLSKDMEEKSKNPTQQQVQNKPQLMETATPSTRSEPTSVKVTTKAAEQPATTLKEAHIAASSSLFSDTDHNDDGDDDFFSKLAQPKLPIAASEKPASSASKNAYDDSDDDLFTSNKAAATAIKTSKPKISTAKTIEKPGTKKKALFDSDSSNEDENADNLFKVSKSTKSTFQSTTKKTSTAASTVKLSTTQNVPSKTKSLFSESDDDDDDLFGSSASKGKNSHVSSATRTATSDPLVSKQPKLQKDAVPSSKPADNPLADLLE